LGPLKKDIAEIERMLKALIKSLENKPLNPGTLWDHTGSIGDDTLILPQLTTTNREMIIF